MSNSKNNNGWKILAGVAGAAIALFLGSKGSGRTSTHSNLTGGTGGDIGTHDTGSKRNG